LKSWEQLGALISPLERSDHLLEEALSLRIGPAYVDVKGAILFSDCVLDRPIDLITQRPDPRADSEKASHISAGLQIAVQRLD